MCPSSCSSSSSSCSSVSGTTPSTWCRPPLRRACEWRAEGSSADAGRAKASDFLASAGPSIVESPSVSATRDADTASVSVSGRAVTVVPGFSLHVEARAVSPTERFREDPG